MRLVTDDPAIRFSPGGVPDQVTAPLKFRRRPSLRPTLVAGLALLSILLSACAPPATATPATGLPTPVPPQALATIPPPKPLKPTDASGPSVSIENFNYVSANVTVPAGTTVVWTNNDDVEHTITASDNSFSSQPLQTDAQFSHTFTTPGSYSYFCAIHPFMTGKVIVQ
jgi:plastocyanin